MKKLFDPENITEEDNIFFDDGITGIPEDGERLLLRFALKSLTSRQKEVIHLVFFNGESQKQIAILLHITQSTVAKHLYSAMKKLRKVCLGGENGRSQN